jgi:DNA mismatch repair protein MutH
LLWKEARTKNHLLPTRGFNSLAEIRVIPSVDFTIPLDERCVGIHLGDLLWERTVGTSLRRSRHDDGEVEELAELGMSEHIVAELGCAVVLDKLQKAQLMVNYEKHFLGELMLG